MQMVSLMVNGAQLLYYNRLRYNIAITNFKKTSACDAALEPLYFFNDPGRREHYESAAQMVRAGWRPHHAEILNPDTICLREERQHPIGCGARISDALRFTYYVVPARELMIASPPRDRPNRS